MNEESLIAALPPEQFEMAVTAALQSSEWDQSRSESVWSWYPLPGHEVEVERGFRDYLILSAMVGPYHIIWWETEFPRRRLLLDVQKGDPGVDADYLLEVFEDWLEAAEEVV